MDLNFLKELERIHILVAGEVGIDEYIWGDTRRISPEAPVPVVEVESQSNKLGLAANVAQNLVSLGARVSLVSVCGVDADGRLLQKMITDAGIRSTSLLTDPSRPTLRKTRIIAQKQHVVRIDYERSHPISGPLCRKFRENICDQLSAVDAVIVQDYGKGIWNSETMKFVKEAREKKKPVFVDPSVVNPLEIYWGVTLLSPNILEAQTLCGQMNLNHRLLVRDDEQLKRMGLKILETTSVEHVIITCGDAGMVNISKQGRQFTRIPTFAREVFDVTGAGDTVIAVLCLMYVLEQPIERCMEFANAAAGVVVGKIGTASVTREELKLEMNRLEISGLIKNQADSQLVSRS